MKKQFLFILVLSGLFLSSVWLNAQTKPSRSNMTLYYELWGNGLTSTINMDLLFRMDHDLVIVPRIGIGTKDNFLGRGYTIISVPMEFTAMMNLYKTRHFLEVGPGLTLANMDGTNVGFMTVRAGYRYQPERSWFVFRAGIIPMLDFYSSRPDIINPHHSWNLMAGLSVGVAL
ncbi:hypothetical protein ACE01N_10785 [Saccharicrinis sp. FJH2]|uniref:hypothetical protein n=1 Tax=Saccharicrinis sp. FJH65 TaxID=3344659 RepID=UPI0035F3E687